MRSATGRWVSGDDFFDREPELCILEQRVRDGNHVLLSGQRRMGKTSIIRELGHRLTESGGWSSLFADVEDATCPEDVIADIARAAYPVRPIVSRLGNVAGLGRRAVEAVEEIGVSGFRLKIRAGLDAGNWRRHGEHLLRACAEYERRVLLVIDELPIFLQRMLRAQDGATRVEGFLSWLRGVLQGLGDHSPILIVSGSIGLMPLVQRLGIPDRINYLDPFRLGPWNRETSIECFHRLARSTALAVDDGVAEAVHDALGIGIPHHLQSFFARLREFAIMENRDWVTVADVEKVYRTGMLGPAGQNDLAHYETRLRDALDEESRSIAMEILAEAATQEAFTAGARTRLGEIYSRVVGDAQARIAEVLDVLVHDGYLAAHGRDHIFPSRLLRDWWAARFRDHHVSVADRSADAAEGPAR
ncbi:MAG: ATP-binding protein [Spirochaetaceae bacterium]|nr:ATP-binding protein [Spirochaetaceae bacterium]